MTAGLRLTREQFLEGYAERSGTTVEHLLEARVPVRCDCGDDICEGWAMGYRADARKRADARNNNEKGNTDDG